ncbi:MAG: Peptidase C39 family protein [Syntrophus sp. PtaU1.Bin005]|jgi:ABC-type bacteriocin/lantibiotic exporter with double-glycine peptidase domain|uniref:C39 family peptidase n=1 Tax=Syntrophus TaxID=43773 RepID=UPI0009C57B94|nr:MAG: Peptidase C39 family protein [Syntrophus sp. PtaB.Bin138]OPY83842.1 MAG: Peptidase C39 family protein [Syntrophus sp. PtaU1.Bin005]
MRLLSLASLLLIVINGVPFVKQEPLKCGPAALASVLMFYGHPESADDIATEVYSAKLRGTLISDMENFARSRNFKTALGQGTVDQLKQYLDAGKPVIVAVDTGFWRISKPHYLLVYGYGESGIVAHSGTEPSQIYSYSKFQRLWNKTGCTFLVVFP